MNGHIKFVKRIRSDYLDYLLLAVTYTTLSKEAARAETRGVIVYIESSNGDPTERQVEPVGLLGWRRRLRHEEHALGRVLRRVRERHKADEGKDGNGCDAAIHRSCARVTSEHPILQPHPQKTWISLHETWTKCQRKQISPLHSDLIISNHFALIDPRIVTTH